MRDINPLNVLNQREVSMMPEHFTKIKHEIDYTSGRTHNDVVDDIKTWIFNNLDGRFTVTEYEKADNDNIESILKNNETVLTQYWKTD